MYAALKSIGAYIPPRVMTNHDLETIVDTSDEWIFKRTGIRERHIAAEHETTSDLASEAAKVAIQRAGLAVGDVDAIICATISPDYMCMPSTACIVGKKIGATGIPAFDISAACSGFIYALNMARAFVISGVYRHVLIIGAEKLSAFVDYTDRTTCVLFGDGAGAAIIGGTKEPEKRIIDINISADGNYSDFLITPGCGSANPCSQRVIEDHAQFMKMKGNETFKVAVKTLTSDVNEILAKNSIDREDIRHFIPHQANYRIIKAVGDALNLNDEQIVLTVEKYGNTSAASIPMAINEIYESGRLRSGDLMLLDAFGGGLTWGSALLTFAG